MLSPSRGGRKGGETLGRLVKLLGNFAVEVLAMADALRMAKGFLPVRELPWLPLPPLTRLLVPLVFVVLEMPLAAGFEEEEPLPDALPPFEPRLSAEPDPELAPFEF